VEHITLPKTHIEVSAIGLGALQGSGYSKERDKSFLRTLRAAVERGVTLIDTAEGYGNGRSEKLVGEAVRGMREKVVLASKFSHNHSSPNEIRNSLEASLRRLKTDYLDIYQQHWPPTNPSLPLTLEALAGLKDEGKIRAVGVCNWMEPEFSEIDSPEKIDTLQICYNLLWRNAEPNIFRMCREKNIPVFAYSPLAQGLLSGRIPADASAISGRKQNILFQDEPRVRFKDLFDVITTIAVERGKTAAQVALRWILDKENIIPLIGMSSEAQLEENMGALGWKLSEEEIRRLDSISLPFSAHLKPHDTMWGWHSRG
jgi:myo-inositol catabolism protein IolS